MAKNSDQSPQINSLKKKDGSQTKTPEETIERAKEYFENLFEKPPEEEIKQKEAEMKEKWGEGKTHEEKWGSGKIPVKEKKKLYAKIKLKEIKKSIRKLKNGKAAGPDSIPNEFIKAGGVYLAKQLLHLFNRVRAEEDTPDLWQDGVLYALYKDKGDATDLLNYRGITVNNSISKVFTNIWNERLNSLVENQGYIFFTISNLIPPGPLQFLPQGEIRGYPLEIFFVSAQNCFSYYFPY